MQWKKSPGFKMKRTHYNNFHQVTLIPGEGIGPEVTAAARACLNATGVPIEWDMRVAGEKIAVNGISALPEALLDSIRRNKVALKGPITTPIGTGMRSVNVALRQTLDLFACVRPCRLYPGVPSHYEKVDLILIRENTEDLYAGIEYDRGNMDTKELIEWVKAHGGRQIQEDAAISLKPISALASERIIRFAFEFAVKNKRKKITAVHKANIMKYTDGLFLKIFRKIGLEYAGKIEYQDQLVDSLCMQLVQSPESYDVLVLPNLYGDIVSDLCAGLIGGLGVAPGVNLGDTLAVFEPVHGSALQLSGQDKANPIAAILSGALMLRHLGESTAAERLERAVTEVLCEGRFITADLKGKKSIYPAVGTRRMTDVIIRKLEIETMSVQNIGGSHA